MSPFEWFLCIVAFGLFAFSLIRDEVRRRVERLGRAARLSMVLETKNVTVKEGEALIASGEGWIYGGYSVCDSMNVYRYIPKVTC